MKIYLDVEDSEFNELFNVITANVKKARLKKKMTQEQLALAIVIHLLVCYLRLKQDLKINIITSSSYI
jgi:hypothetical protein